RQTYPPLLPLRAQLLRQSWSGELDGRAAIGMDRGILKRIVALLFALAELADRASHARWPVRVFVLAILRYGETAARQLVETGHPRPQACVAVTPAGSSPAAAAQLALYLLLLALALAELLAGDTHVVHAAPLGPPAGSPAPEG